MPQDPNKEDNKEGLAEGLINVNPHISYEDRIDLFDQARNAGLDDTTIHERQAFYEQQNANLPNLQRTARQRVRNMINQGQQIDDVQGETVRQRDRVRLERQNARYSEFYNHLNQFRQHAHELHDLYNETRPTPDILRRITEGTNQLVQRYNDAVYMRGRWDMQLRPEVHRELDDTYLMLRNAITRRNNRQTRRE